MTEIVDVKTPDGRVLRVHDGGGDGLPVIAHHGTPDSGGLLPPALRDAQERGLRLISYDRPGYGGSTRQAGRTVASAAVDVAVLLDDLGLDRFVTWGSSGGGPHALACAALLPGRCLAAATVAGVAPFGAEGLDWLAGMGQDNLDEFGAAVSGEATLRPWLETARTGMLSGSLDELVDMMQNLLPPVDVGALDGELGTWLHDTMHDGLATGVDGWLDDDLAFVGDWGLDLAAITVPTLVVAGGQDLMVPVSHGHWLAERLPGDADVQDDEGHLSLLKGISRVHGWLADHASA